MASATLASAAGIRDPVVIGGAWWRARLARFRVAAVQPVDSAGIGAFRIAFGVLIVWDAWTYGVRGWIQLLWVDPPFHFTYFGLGWIRPLPAFGMDIAFAVLAVSAVGVAVGAFYRPAAWIVWVVFTYQFLLDQAVYLNHFYAATLFTLLLAVVPADSALALRRGRGRRELQGRAPAWCYWLLRAQIGIIYVYAGLAKLDADWLSGAPIELWLSARTGTPAVDFLVTNGLGTPVLAHGGVLFDLFIVPALLWRRTRACALATAVVFHFVNAQIFNIGIFPWMMIAATTLFSEPSWPRRMLGASAIQESRGAAVPSFSMSATGTALVAGYVLIQTIVPLRHVAYPGAVAWTEEGHRFSWRMMLREKRGTVAFKVVSQDDTLVVPLQAYLRPWQIDAMAVRPDMIQQFATFVADQYAETLNDRPRVFVDALVSLNGRPPRRLVDPTVDLGLEPRRIWPPAAWILRE